MNSPQPDYRSFELPYQNTGFDAEMAHTKKNRGGCCFCGCGLGCLVFLLFLCLVVFATWYCFLSGAVPLVVSEETTIITEPLKSDGKTIDFHQAIKDRTEPNVQAEDNAFRTVLLGYGQAIFETTERLGNREDAGWQHLEMCKTLDIDPNTPPTLFLSRLSTANIQRWLTEVGEGLDIVQVAAAKPHYFIPLTRRSEKDLVVMSQPIAVYAFHENLSDALRTRATTQFQLKETASAWKDILTSLRLFRLVTINQAWAKALAWNDEESLLAPVSVVCATLSQWTPEQLEQAINDLESLPDWQDRQTTLQMMQFVLLDLISGMNDPSNLHNRLRGELPIEMREAVDLLQVIAFDWNLVAKELNSEIKTYEERLERATGKSPEEQFELLRLRQPGVSHPSPLSQETLQEFLRDHFDEGGPLDAFFTSGRSKLTGAFVGHSLVTWVAGEMYRLQLMEESRCQALRLTLALERFHRDKGDYPESLTELGLKPMSTNVNLQYEKKGTGYRIHNNLFQLEKE